MPNEKSPPPSSNSQPRPGRGASPSDAPNRASGPDRPPPSGDPRGGSRDQRDSAMPHGPGFNPQSGFGGWPPFGPYGMPPFGQSPFPQPPGMPPFAMPPFGPQSGGQQQQWPPFWPGQPQQGAQQPPWLWSWMMPLWSWLMSWSMWPGSMPPGFMPWPPFPDGTAMFDAMRFAATRADFWYHWFEALAQIAHQAANACLAMDGWHHGHHMHPGPIHPGDAEASVDTAKLKEALQSIDAKQAAMVMHAVQSMQAMENMRRGQNPASAESGHNW